jgi:hypothetical protein
MRMSKQYEVTIHSVGPMATDYFVTTNEPPYWEVHDDGLHVYTGDMQSVAFVKRDYFSAVTVEVIDVDEPVLGVVEPDPDTLGLVSG